MKTKLALIGAVLAAAVINLQAQTNDTDIKTRVISFTQEMRDAGNIAVTLSPCYSPNLKDSSGASSQWGACIAATYTFEDGLGKFLFTGIRLDYLGGEFWAPSINGGLRADVQVFGHTFTPFAYTGLVFPLSGLEAKVGSVGVVTGAGFKTTVWTGTLFKKEASVFCGAAVEKWAMQDGHQFDGNIYRGFVGLKIKL